MLEQIDRSKSNNYLKFYLLSLVVIIVDQSVKLLIYHNMDLGTGGQIQIF